LADKPVKAIAATATTRRNVRMVVIPPLAKTKRPRTPFGFRSMRREAQVSPAIPLQASARARTGPYKDGQDRRREPSRGEEASQVEAIKDIPP